MWLTKRSLKNMEKEIMDMVSKQVNHINTISDKVQCVENSEEGEYMENMIKQTVYFIDEQEETLKATKIKRFSTEEELNSSKKILKKMAKEAEEVEKRLDEFEENLLKYNVPYLDACKGLEDYLEDMKEFTKIWKEEAEKCRMKGSKSLLEWLHLLGEERKFTVEEIKAVVINLGTRISLNLVEFFMIVAISASNEGLMQKLDDFSVILKFLSVEENSIVIESFLSVVKLMERTMKVTDENQCSSSEASSGENLFEDYPQMYGIRDILREILRLEVALCCPCLPMVLTDEVYCSMGNHLNIVFEPRLEKVERNLNQMKNEEFGIRVRDEDPKTLFPSRGTLVGEAKEIWNKLVF